MLNVKPPTFRLMTHELAMAVEEEDDGRVVMAVVAASGEAREAGGAERPVGC